MPTMKARRTAVYALCALALLCTAGCGSSPTEADRLIQYNTKNDGGIVLRKAADVSKLEGAPEDFRQFMAGVIDTNIHWGAPDRKCPTTITVEKYDTSGYAYGSIGECAGAILMWGKPDGIWQQVWVGHDVPACAELRKYAIPTLIAGKQCWNGKKLVPYAG